MERNSQILAAAHRAWNGASTFRAKRTRYKNFTYGRQWDDLMDDGNGKVLTEGAAAEKKGRTPLTNNLIRQLVKGIVGRYRYLQSENRPTDARLKQLYADNLLDELDCRALEEYLISGCTVQRIVAETRHDGRGIWVENVNPSRFFVNRVNDPRGWDTEIVGMIHDMSVAEVIMRYSHGSTERAAELREICAKSTGVDVPCSIFYHPVEGKCRVIEVWTLESMEAIDCHDPSDGSLTTLPISRKGEVDAENERRAKAGDAPIATTWRVSTHWHCRFLAPGGELLDETVSPYAHGSHPFVFKMYPLTDGEIHPFVEDIIDQQKYINRLITMIDHVMGSSAKGVLLFPFEQKLESMTWEDICKQWSATDSVIAYKPRPGQPLPQQVMSPTSDMGAYRLLDMEMKLFKDISGVGDALLGHSTSGITGQGLYESQAHNATIALSDTFESFKSMIAQRDKKMLQSMVM